MSSTGTELLRAILENPAEDTPRLIYAEYLDELPPVRKECSHCGGTQWLKGQTTRGRRHRNPFTGRLEHPAPVNFKIGCGKCGGTFTDPGAGTVIDPSNSERAEFIRGQCKLAHWKRVTDAYEERRKTHPNMPPYTNCECGRILLKNTPCEYCCVKTRNENLLESHYFKKWAEPLGAIGHHQNGIWVPQCEWTFERGFVERIKVRAWTLLYDNCVWAAFQKNPITSVELLGFAPREAVPHLPRNLGIDVYHVLQYRGGGNIRQFELVPELFHEIGLLCPDHIDLSTGTHVFESVSMEFARAVASRAAVNWMRKRKGIDLPPLPL